MTHRTLQMVGMMYRQLAHAHAILLTKAFPKICYHMKLKSTTVRQFVKYGCVVTEHADELHKNCLPVQHARTHTRMHACVHMHTHVDTHTQCI